MESTFPKLLKRFRHQVEDSVGGGVSEQADTLRVAQPGCGRFPTARTCERYDRLDQAGWVVNGPICQHRFHVVDNCVRKIKIGSGQDKLCFTRVLPRGVVLHFVYELGELALTESP